jgi:hypothetical protein
VVNSLVLSERGFATMDLWIGVGIWMCGVGMALVGIEMTITPPVAERQKLKWIYRGAFVVLGAAFIALNVWQTERISTRETSERSLHEQEQRHSEGEIKYMQGELDSINRVLGVLATNSSPQQLASALRAATIARIDNRPALQRTSNGKLRKSVLAFCRQLRGFVAENDQQEEQIATQWQSGIHMPTGTPTEEQKQALNKAWEQMNQRLLQLSNQFQLGYKNDFEIDALNFRDELIRRLGPQGPPVVPGPGRTPLSLSGWIAPMSVGATADYLEELAKKLPD